MKHLFKIQPLTYLFLLITFITGYFKESLMFYLLIFIHESGHILMAFIFHWHLEKIVVLPFGSVSIFDNFVNIPLKEELLVAISGPLMQILWTLILGTDFYFYSQVILFINLLPIFPLDGSKILSVFFNQIFSFKLSHRISLFFSYFLALFCFFYFSFQRRLIYVLFALSLIPKIISELENHEFIFQKFLYERYLYNFDFKKFKQVFSLSEFKRDYFHYIYTKKTFLSEKEVLKHKFHGQI